MKQIIGEVSIGKKIVVTGGAGFLGGNFVHYLANRYPNYHVVNLDVLTYARNLETCHLLKGRVNYQLIKGDITDRELIFELFEKQQLDWVVHFAAESYVDRAVTNPDIFIQTNVVGTQMLLGAAR